MNVSFLTQRIVELEHLPASHVQKVLRRAFSEIADSLAAGHSVRVKGLGSWTVSRAKARAIHLPDGTVLNVADRPRIKFVPSVPLKARLTDNKG